MLTATKLKSRLGNGISRIVYEHPTNPNYVVKKEIPGDGDGANAKEAQWWAKLYQKGLGAWVPRFCMASDNLLVVERLEEVDEYETEALSVFKNVLNPHTYDVSGSNIMRHRNGNLKLSDLAYEDWSGPAFHAFCVKLRKYDPRTGALK